MQSVKNTSFLEAVAAGIQHEKDFFDFCMKTHDELPAGPIKNLFYDLAEDSEDHIQMIEKIYRDNSGGDKLPNLKHLGQVHKFHATAIQKLIKKLDRNLKRSTQGNEIEALRLALQEAEDALHGFEKLAHKFEQSSIKILFSRLANFNRERAVLLEGCMVFQQPHVEQDTSSRFHSEQMEIPLMAQQPTKRGAAPRRRTTKPKPAAKAKKKKSALRPKKKSAKKK